VQEPEIPADRGPVEGLDYPVVSDPDPERYDQPWQHDLREGESVVYVDGLHRHQVVNTTRPL